MIVDDSAIIRGLIARTLEAEPGIVVVASVPDGEQAVRTVSQHDVDVVVLDIEMPVMDGMTALPLILAKRPDVKVIVASTLTRRNADMSLRALSKGATDYIPKPTSIRELAGADEFKRELVTKVLALGAARRRHRPADKPPQFASAPKPAQGREPVALRRASNLPATVLAVGSSTGGPQALATLFSDLKGMIRVPVLITQHMPPTFTAILAEHIGRASGLSCAEATNGERIAPGRIYVAPGDFHMEVTRDGDQRVIRLHQGPRENFCRPAVDPMLRSIAAAYGPGTLCAILTGMGHDGLAGGRAVVGAGGTMLAQ
ncbi:MAG: chemotaxis-specific protein-glutamate methyltransferase CheB, partial [Alphaproteobacteria bacterium]